MTILKDFEVLAIRRYRKFTHSLECPFARNIPAKNFCVILKNILSVPDRASARFITALNLGELHKTFLL